MDEEIGKFNKKVIPSLYLKFSKIAEGNTDTLVDEIFDNLSLNISNARNMVENKTKLRCEFDEENENNLKQLIKNMFEYIDKTLLKKSSKINLDEIKRLLEEKTFNIRLSQNPILNESELLQYTTSNNDNNILYEKNKDKFNNLNIFLKKNLIQM